MYIFRPPPVQTKTGADITFRPPPVQTKKGADITFIFNICDIKLILFYHIKIMFDMICMFVCFCKQHYRVDRLVEANSPRQLVLLYKYKLYVFPYP